MPPGFPWTALYVSGTEHGRAALARGLGAPVEHAAGLEAAQRRLDGGSPRPRVVVVRPPLADGTPRAVCASAHTLDAGIDCFGVDASVPEERVQTVTVDSEADPDWTGVAETIRHAVTHRSQAPYPVPDGEVRRCSAAAGVLESARESDRPDAAARAAAEAAGTPHALVGVITHRREHIVGRTGKPVPGPFHRASTVCTHTIADPGPLVVPDRRADPRFADMEAMAEFGMEAYAGAPIEIEGERIGTLCVYEGAQRSFDSETRERLAGLAADLGAHLEAVRVA
jgi:GAF domain-containing protein